MDRGQVRSEVRWLKGVPNGAPITVYLWSYRGHQGEAVNLAEAWRAIAEAADKAYFVGEGFVKHCPRCLGQCCLDDFGYKVVHMGAKHRTHHCDSCADGTLPPTDDAVRKLRAECEALKVRAEKAEVALAEALQKCEALEATAVFRQNHPE